MLVSYCFILSVATSIHKLNKITFTVMCYDGVIHLPQTYHSNIYASTTKTKTHSITYHAISIVWLHNIHVQLFGTIQTKNFLFLMITTLLEYGDILY